MRICATCGKPIEFECMTNDDGWFFTHDGDCFSKYMDKTYGVGKWRSTNGEEDEYGGYYEYLDEDGEYKGTGIYYTEYEDCEVDE